ncbi:MAG: hypothetical protein GF350_03025 [Chitinivibrionales bacterium]|nr:hypothetical protein [Chitinivibrionales bacterium]
MERTKLLQRAEQEAANALPAGKEPGIKFQRRGGSRYWDDASYREIFDVHFRVWKRSAYYAVILDPDTGAPLAWTNSTALAETKPGSITGQEAIAIAQEDAKKHIPADAGMPCVSDITEQGNALILVAWKSASTGETIEVTVHPGLKKVCRMQRKTYPPAIK